MNVNSLIWDPFTFTSTKIFLLILHAEYLKCYQDFAKVIIFWTLRNSKSNGLEIKFLSKVRLDFEINQ